jgi:hypothetical protein
MKTAADLPELPAAMEQEENVCKARHVAFDDYLQLFDESVRDLIRESAKADGVTHVVCMECLQMDSGHFGRRSSMIVGSKQTYSLKDILGTKYARIGDVPSRFQYPVAYAAV